MLNKLGLYMNIEWDHCVGLERKEPAFYTDSVNYQKLLYNM